ncbi:biotin--[acetyl-CoA-carboxylase] ligase [Thermococcus thermotolerans]|uniref:biotin--[acetyl-CoA-carboxylase] ligase n=1 Tax=Thermococcus thermotolerans TaxID=2969672 RepID=UPI0021588F10|nr:biotin--[acetyl-CoA-carboxylase] ligase [Thermococcus thermotolerans]
MRGMIKDSPVKRGILSMMKSRRMVSGEEIARELGVSRVSIWKHIKELQALGYEIETTGKGYRLISTPEKPYPWELDVRSYYLLKTPSTMEVAGRLAERGEPEWTFVIAEEQTAGRARRGGRWLSRRGGLYFSVILRPRIRLTDVGNLMEPSLKAVARTLRDYGIPAEVLEEGVYTGGKKIAGVLLEAAGELDMVRYAIIGVGLNVSNPVPDDATSMVRVLGRAPTLIEVSRKLFRELKLSLGTFLNQQSEVESDAEG